MNAFLGQVPIRAGILGQNAPPWTIGGEIERKRQECYFLSLTYDSAVAKYHHEDTPMEYYGEILEPARLALNTCIDELQELVDTADFGPRASEHIARIPFTWNERTNVEPAVPGEPTAAAPETPATAAPAPVSTPVPATEPVAEPIHCDPMQGQFYDPSTGQCRGSVRGGFAPAFGPTATSATTSFMSGGRIIKVEPLRAGRF
jgi:hypothetical protein